LPFDAVRTAFVRTSRGCK